MYSPARARARSPPRRAQDCRGPSRRCRCRGLPTTISTNIIIIVQVIISSSYTNVS